MPQGCADSVIGCESKSELFDRFGAAPPLDRENNLPKNNLPRICRFRTADFSVFELPPLLGGKSCRTMHPPYRFDSPASC